MNEPNWWKILNIEASEFERSKYAGLDPGKFRLKDLNLLRKVMPGVYESAAEEVKEGNEYITQNGKRFGKTRLGRKIGSIPLYDAALHPELMHDPKAQDRYWQDHPEMKAARPK